ncbi:MAG: hypothetical protein GF320_03650, partial [Armatimonadia bacterium]|nr:hypothetical protein [Armatimonadia bacterium]
LALADQGHAAYEAGALFAAGQSSAATDWPFCHPGPSDTWAGSQSHEFVLLLGLADEPPEGPWALDLHLADAHAGNPPLVSVRLNGAEVHRFRPERGGGDDSILAGDYSAAREQHIHIDLPADRLQAGTNVLVIETLEGSWMIYDAVRLTGPADARLSPPGEITQVDRVQPIQALQETEDGLGQVVRLWIRRVGDPTTAMVRVDGEEVASVDLEQGSNDVEIALPRVDRRREATLEVTTEAGVELRRTVTLHPVRDWTIYLLHHTHLDIGYTHTQDEVEQLQMRFLAEIGDHIDRSADGPEEARFAWLPEGLWPVESYLRQASDEEEAVFLDQVRGGHLGLDALYGNALTSLYSEEELLALVEYARRLEREYGVTIDSAMLSDVPGATWGLVPALARSGVKYLSMGPNMGHRIGWIQLWNDRPFWWVSPSGEERILCWMAGTGYSWFHGGWDFDDGHITERHATRFFDYLQRLEDEDYPYDLVHVRYNIGGDNGPPDAGLSAAVAEWNERYAAPKIIIATASEALGELERRYGEELPAVSGELTPYWEDGAASTAADTALVRRAVERLVQARAMDAMGGDGPDLEPGALWEAWREAILYDEHTWGAHNSISEPDSEFAIAQAEHKQGFALEADRLSRELLARSLGDGGTGDAVSAIEVVNTLSWPRTDVVELPADWELAGDRVLGPGGSPVPSQRLTSGALAFLAAEVPAMGSAVYRIEAGEPHTGGSAMADGLRLSNEHLELEVDPETGAVGRLSYAGSEDNLVDAETGMGLNEYVYVAGRDASVREHASNVRVRVGEAGPLVASLIIESDAPGARSLRRELRLTSGSRELTLANTIDKLPVREKEAVLFAFPLIAANPETRYDAPWSVVEVEADQLRGGCRNYLTVQRWVDVCGDAGGATLVTVDAPLIQVGDIHTDVAQMWSMSDSWLRHLDPSGLVFSYVMNNYWETNYKADQEGEVEFRYALTPYRGAYDVLEATRRGMAEVRPLLARPAEPRSEGLESAVEVSTPGVVVTSMGRAPDGEGLLVRLFAASGRPETVDLSVGGQRLDEVEITDLDGYDGERAELPLGMPAWGIRTVKLPGPS